MSIFDTEDYGKIKEGTVVAFDTKYMVAQIAPLECPSCKINNVVCLFDRYDPDNKAFSFRAPSEKAPCLYTTIGGVTYLLGLYSPLNYVDDDNSDNYDSPYGNTQNRRPHGLEETVLPGTVVDRNSMGSSEVFTDTMKKTTVVPEKLQSIWNILNCIWDNICLIFRMKSGPMDVCCEVTPNEDNPDVQDCNTTILFRRNLDERKEDATTMVDIRIGEDAGIINMKINGENFLEVDGQRNVTLIARQIDVNAEQINYNVTANKKFPNHNGEVNMLNVDTVHLP